MPHLRPANRGYLPCVFSLGLIAKSRPVDCRPLTWSSTLLPVISGSQPPARICPGYELYQQNNTPFLAATSARQCQALWHVPGRIQVSTMERPLPPAKSQRGIVVSGACSGMIGLGFPPPVFDRVPKWFYGLNRHGGPRPKCRHHPRSIIVVNRHRHTVVCALTVCRAQPKDTFHPLHIISF